MPCTTALHYADRAMSTGGVTPTSSGEWAPPGPRGGAPASWDPPDAPAPEPPEPWAPPPPYASWDPPAWRTASPQWAPPDPRKLRATRRRARRRGRRPVAREHRIPTRTVPFAVGC